MQYMLIAVVAGLAVGLGNYITEELGFRLCKLMERHGQMKRLAPGTKRLFQVATVSRPAQLTLLSASVQD
jgi:hypothetical protein